MQAEASARARLRDMDARCQQLHMQKTEADRRRQDLELELQRERDKFGHTKTVQELRAFIQTLQAEISNLQQHIKLNKVCRCLGMGPCSHRPLAGLHILTSLIGFPAVLELPMLGTQAAN